MNQRSWTRSLVALLALACSACVTISDGELDPLTPAPPARPGLVEYTIGDFEFTLEGGKIFSSQRAGRTLSNAILSQWQRKGYIENFRYVERSRFTGAADYNITLKGSQRGTSRRWQQFLSILSFLLIPHSVDTQFDIQYEMEHIRRQTFYDAAVRAGFVTWWETFLLLALPLASDGGDKTIESMADHLYAELAASGAFEDPPDVEARSTHPGAGDPAVEPRQTKKPPEPSGPGGHQR